MFASMNEKPLPSPAARADDPGESAGAQDVAVDPGPPRATEVAAPEGTSQVTFTHASHELLFAEPVLRCDVCDAPLREDADDGAQDSIGGRGLYLWIRGGKTVYEEPPLCTACGTAIGMSALARWDIEEEEG
jgi:hypothetical protein